MRRNWDKVAKKEFDELPEDYQKDWQDFRDSVYRRK
jgi:hypothetical protein